MNLACEICAKVILYPSEQSDFYYIFQLINHNDNVGFITFFKMSFPTKGAKNFGDDLMICYMLYVFFTLWFELWFYLCHVIAP